MGCMKKFIVGAIAVAIIAVGFCGVAIKDKIPSAQKKKVCSVFNERRSDMKLMLGLMAVTVIGIGFCVAALKNKFSAKKTTV